MNFTQKLKILEQTHINSVIISHNRKVNNIKQLNDKLKHTLDIDKKTKILKQIKQYEQLIIRHCYHPIKKVIEEQTWMKCTLCNKKLQVTLSSAHNIN